MQWAMIPDEDGRLVSCKLFVSIPKAMIMCVYRQSTNKRKCSWVTSSDHCKSLRGSCRRAATGF
jgi:hypothetical protein